MYQFQFIELYDYILSMLYYLKRNNEFGPFSLKEIIDFFEYPATPNDINDFGSYLEAEGYIKADFILGDVYVAITPSGIVYIENKENIISDFEEFLKTKIPEDKKLKIISKFSKTSAKNSKKPIIDEVDEIINFFNSIKELKNTDLKKDARILKIELQKEVPEIEIISVKLDKLNQFASIKNNISKIKEYLYYIDKY